MSGHQDAGQILAELDHMIEQGWATGPEKKAAAEIRRITAQRDELLEALQRLIAAGLHEREYREFMSDPAHYARVAIAKTTGEST